MKLKVEQLTHVLKTDSFSTYWLTGEEPLLLQEAADTIRKHYQGLGFADREIFNVENGYRWEEFTQSARNLSLFSEKKIFELRLATSKLDEEGKKAINAYLDEGNSSFIMLITSRKLDAGVMNTKWFKNIQPKIALVQIWPISKDKLANWLSKRLISEGINTDTQALQLLSDKVEGNLLAAIQEIEKLKLLTNKNEDVSINLDSKLVMQVIADSSRYSVYSLVDAALTGNPGRCQKILAALRDEGLFPLLIVNAITRELRLLLPMIEKKAQGQDVNAIMQTHHVWFSRKQAVSNALHCLQVEDIWKILDKCRNIDHAIKGLSSSNPWDELSKVVLELSGVKTASMMRFG